MFILSAYFIHGEVLHILGVKFAKCNLLMHKFGCLNAFCNMWVCACVRSVMCVRVLTIVWVLW